MRKTKSSTSLLRNGVYHSSIDTPYLKLPTRNDAPIRAVAVILGELYNLERFTHVRELVAFIGLAPKEKISCSSIKGKPRLCKIGNNCLRKTLYMPALVAIQFNPVIIPFYERLQEKGKNGKVIVCAVMRKLVHMIFGVLKFGKKFDSNYKPIFA